VTGRVPSPPSLLHQFDSKGIVSTANDLRSARMKTTAAVTLDRIKQIAIPVNSVEEAKLFYRDTLGLRHLFDAPPVLSFFD